MRILTNLSSGLSEGKMKCLISVFGLLVVVFILGKFKPFPSGILFYITKVCALKRYGTQITIYTEFFFHANYEYCSHSFKRRKNVFSKLFDFTA